MVVKKVEKEEIEGEEEISQLYEIIVAPCIHNHTPSCFLMVKDISYLAENKRVREFSENQNSMTQNVSHELRNPINCIISMLNIA